MEELTPLKCLTIAARLAIQVLLSEKGRTMAYKTECKVQSKLFLLVTPTRISNLFSNESGWLEVGSWLVKL